MPVALPVLRPPRTWGDCQLREDDRTGPARPCEWACRHNLLVEFDDADGDTCALRAAEQGGMTSRDVASSAGVSRQLIDQITAAALGKLREAHPRLLDLVERASSAHAPDVRIMRALARLGPSTWDALADDLGLPDGSYDPPGRASDAARARSSERGRMWLVLVAMCGRGVVRRVGGRYEIAP